ncbi:PKD domain-containing protein [Georgenia satyanarayanai]|uniref:PKD domain-containing protein n=1 Tax=Georgenia satyanarayanai TaxID=860221 RepID=UPI001264BC58|nr:PKD domain-containing protein [Georgenia satyanarayanai]
MIEQVIVSSLFLAGAPMGVTGDEGIGARLNDEQRDLTGSARRAWEVPRFDDPSPVKGGPVAADPYCSPVTYVWGRYETNVTACDPVPEGEWAPEPWWSDGEDEEDVEEVPRQLLAFTREDVQSLLVNSGSLVIQPDQSWVLVGTETVAMTDAAEHVLGTQVLDLDIDARVNPVLFTWDFGDGSVPLTGTDPGAPWPDHTVSHVYSDPGAVTISLRTEWDADFRVEGTSTWIPSRGAR